MNVRNEPAPGLELAAVTLGSVSGLLFFLPVMGVPLGALGVLLGFAGLIGTIFGWTSLRWSVVGIVVSATALGIGVLLTRDWLI